MEKAVTAVLAIAIGLALVYYGQLLIAEGKNLLSA
jgi:hypothetical protein